MDQVKSKVSLVEKNGDFFLKWESPHSVHLYRPDFSSDQFTRRLRDELQRRGNLLKAVEGRKADEELKVFDYFSGFGGDALLMACRGHQVVSCEKHPWISQVTRVAWEQAKKEAWAMEINPKLEFIQQDSLDYLNRKQTVFDVIYMDPMFEKLKVTSKSPLPMQIVQELLKEEDSFNFQNDFKCAQKFSNKVVVKMPLKGHSLVSEKPNHQIFGKTVRFDVYLSKHPG